MKGEFYKMEYDAWDEGTVDLSLEEEAAYLRLCHQMYRRKGPIPNSDRLLCALWRCHQNKARPLLQKLISAGKIHITPEGYLTNTRVTQEVDARETLSTRRADAGHTGGIRSGHVRRKALKNNNADEAKRSREEKIREEENREEKIITDSHPSGVSDNDISEDQSSSSGSPIEASPLDETLLPKEPELGFQHPEPRARGTALVPVGHRPTATLVIPGPSGFDEWWSIYPRKKSKDGARKRYAEIVKSGRATERELLDGAMRYASEQAGQDPRYTKHPTTWLNNGCWADEPSPPKFQHHQFRTSADSAIDGIRSFLEEGDYDETNC
jgi:uncharacterized protein YdaU (DUF1376 family)